MKKINMYNSCLSSHYAEVLFLLLLFCDSSEFWNAGMGNAMKFCNLRYEGTSQIWWSKSTSKYYTSGKHPLVQQ